MTFADAVAALDAEGKYGAKRPSMRGYVYAEALDGEAKRVDIVGHDGLAGSIDWRGGVVEAVGGDIAFDPERLTAFVFARDWELAPKDALERSRTGEGTM